MPTINPALFQRVILLQFLTGKGRSENAKKAFKKLKGMEARGISKVTGELLHIRRKVQEEFEEVYDRKLTEFYRRINNNTIHYRFIMNIAIMSAIFECVSKYIDFPYSQSDLDVCSNKDQAIYFFNSKGSTIADVALSAEAQLLKSDFTKWMENNHHLSTDQVFYLNGI